jgi:hypothetical protein
MQTIKKQKLQMNEAMTDIYNTIYDILIKTNPKTHNPTIPETSTPFPSHPPSSTSKENKRKHSNTSTCQ